MAREEFDPWGLCVAPERFEDQLRWLSKHRIVLPLGEFARKLREGRLPEQAVALTFDDGYACVAETAARLLSAFAMPATVFLPVELVQRGRPFWWDELQHLVFGSERDALTLDGVKVPLGNREADDSSWKPAAAPRTARQAAFHQLWAILRPRRPGEIDAAMVALREQSGVSGWATWPKRPMSTEQVRALAGSNIDFGSHALTHPWLTSLGPYEKAREIAASVERCAALTGALPESFAYPYGSYDGDCERLVEKAGYSCACTTQPNAVSRRSRPFALPRLAVGDWTGTQLARALAAAI